MRRGVLNANKDAIATLEFAQDWSLDPVGNWTVFRQDDDGDETWNLDQTRTHSEANEIDTISNPWTDPQHDAAGNMTTVPQPNAPTSGYTATYDAWNRLVKLEDGTDTVAEYEYDGRGRRIVKKTYDGGSLAETRHLYYTNDWQVIEERVGSSSDAERQFIWGVRYVDDLILRDRDTTGNGTLDERLYALQDTNFNVTAVIDTTGVVRERYRYTAYGEVTFLDNNFAEQTGNESPADWEVLYAGYRFDAESHLYHVRHRVLHPTLGRWLQRDPLGYVDGMNLYQYVRSKPTCANDAPGLYGSYGPMEPIYPDGSPPPAPPVPPADDGPQGPPGTPGPSGTTSSSPVQGSPGSYQYQMEQVLRIISRCTGRREDHWRKCQGDLERRLRNCLPFAVVGGTAGGTAGGFLLGKGGTAKGGAAGGPGGAIAGGVGGVKARIFIGGTAGFNIFLDACMVFAFREFGRCYKEADSIMARCMDEHQDQLDVLTHWWSGGHAP